jgi:hypothetical protein
MRENGFVLALWGGIGIVIGAVLPFIFHARESVDGTQFAVSSGIGIRYQFISFFFGLLLAGLALWTRCRPVYRRPIAISALVLGLLGLVGYSLFTVAGVAGITEQTGVQVSWYPNIGLLDSIAGCAACAIAATVMLRTRPPASSEPR